jgi:hypothetical protein
MHDFLVGVQEEERRPARLAQFAGQLVAHVQVAGRSEGGRAAAAGAVS